MTKVQKLVNSFEALRNRSFNLNLYLRYVKTHDPAMFRDMMNFFDGMPGFTDKDDLSKEED